MREAMPTNKSHDGIYLAYFTAEFGTSLGIFLLKDGAFCGGDLGNGMYDGMLSITDDGKWLTGSVEFRTSQGGVMITGATSDLPVSYVTEVSLSLPLEAVDFHSISTITGPVNVRFQKIRSL